MANEGRDALLLDVDPQGSASLWTQIRPPELPRIVCTRQQGNLSDTIQALAERFDNVIIDAGGSDSEELRSALLEADVLIAPFKLSQFDTWTMVHVNQLVKKAHGLNTKLKALAVLSMASTHAHSREFEEAQDMVNEVSEFTLASSVLHQRKAYQLSTRTGRGLVELSDRKAKQEISNLYAEVVHAPEVDEEAA